MKLFRCIVNSGDHIYEAFASGKTKKAMLDVYGGNGDFEKIEDVTKDYLNSQSIDKLEMDLMRSGWGKGETSLISALVQEHISNRK